MHVVFILGLLFSQQSNPPSLTETIDTLVPQIFGYRSQPEADLVDDGEFLRRIMLDLVGAPPSLEDVVAFSGDARPEKRAARIDELLSSPRFSDFWSRRLAEVLVGNYHEVQGGAAFASWLRARLAEQTPWSLIVRRLLEAEGRLSEVPELAWKVAWWKEGDKGATITSAFSRQVFGINLFCARCHDHGFDKWRVDDFHELAAFTRGRKIERTPQDVIVREDPFSPADHVVDPWEPRRYGKPVKMPPRLFGGNVPPEGRKLSVSLADLALQQPYVTRAFVNRTWAWLMGRGIVYPVDEFDLRNKPISPALLKALEGDYSLHGESLRPLVRSICLSRAYQRRSQAVGPEPKVTYRRAVIRPLSAEQLLASLEVATRGSPSGDRVEARRVAGIL
ncbi:MAG TPA: DUF1549 domain-containing protein, partial [Planctomycetota bacterium]|nr:DUF1549 domain-containing protein [Planctomycetota bacterium]